MTSPGVVTEQPEPPWWLGLIQGVALLILGVLFFAAPAATLITLVEFIGLYWLIAGILSIVALFIHRDSWPLRLIGGIVGIVAGMVILRHPLWSTVLLPTTLVLIVGWLGAAYGVVEMVRAFPKRQWSAVVLGLVTLVFGVILILEPLRAALSLPLVLGSLSIVGAFVSIAVAWTDRQRAAGPEPGESDVAAASGS